MKGHANGSRSHRCSCARYGRGLPPGGGGGACRRSGGTGRAALHGRRGSQEAPPEAAAQGAVPAKLRRPRLWPGWVRRDLRRLQRGPGVRRGNVLPTRIPQRDLRWPLWNVAQHLRTASCVRNLPGRPGVPRERELRDCLYRQWCVWHLRLQQPGYRGCAALHFGAAAAPCSLRRHRRLPARVALPGYRERRGVYRAVHLASNQEPPPAARERLAGLTGGPSPPTPLPLPVRGWQGEVSGARLGCGWRTLTPNPSPCAQGEGSRAAQARPASGARRPQRTHMAAKRKPLALRKYSGCGVGGEGWWG